MSQASRSLKNLEAPRPLKSIGGARQTHHATPKYELQTIEELITLIENVADSVSMGQCNPDSMSLLLSCLRTHGPQLEEYSKSTLDQAYVKFRNASQDERLSIITRMNLLELIELRAKSWQISDGINTYYKQKVSDVQPTENVIASSVLNDFTLLDTSPSTQPVLNPGDVIRASGKFTKPTKIPGKNYTKDEVVIRNADSGKVMGIKGRRVHMIEELSETIISFQRVNPGAKERLVQITGPNEEKINYAKQLIEDTIRRNASPVRLDENAIAGAGSCSSLASSNSDEVQPRASRAAVGILQSGNVSSNHKSRHSGANHVLLHSLSTNDASLGEYKYTVNVGQHSIKITGDCIELVRVSKLVLDEYFGSADFLSGVEAGAELGLMSCSSAASLSGGNLSAAAGASIPLSHQLNSTSPFVDSGIGLNVLAKSGSGFANQTSVDNDDDVFIIEDDESTNNTATNPQPNGLTRSRRSHFSHGDTLLDATKETLPKKQSDVRISYENQRLLYFAKSPHSWALPRDWLKICELYPNIVRNKNLDDEGNRFDADQYNKMLQTVAAKLSISPPDADDKKSETSSDTE